MTVLLATSDSGDTIDDPSEEALLQMFQDLEARRGEFLIVQSAADDQTFVQAARNDDGSYVVEFRQGSADQHFQTTVPDVSEAHVLVTMWAFARPGLLERAVWTPLGV